MRTPMMLLVLSGGLLAGCTVPLVPELNTNLSSVNASLRHMNDNLRGASSAPPTVAAAPADVCDRAAFQAGFNDQYVTRWNREIGSRKALYRLQSQQHPEDAAARQNYALYQGKSLRGKAVGGQDYVLKIDPNWHIQNACQSHSYQQGEIAGMRAVDQDLRALAAQESRSGT